MMPAGKLTLFIVTGVAFVSAFSVTVALSLLDPSRHSKPATASAPPAVRAVAEASAERVATRRAREGPVAIPEDASTEVVQGASAPPATVRAKPAPIVVPPRPPKRPSDSVLRRYGI